MKRFLSLTLSAILGVSSFGLVGCGEESKVEETSKVEGPGGTTEVTKETKVKESGENPPAAPPAGEAGAPATPPVEPPK